MGKKHYQVYADKKIHKDVRILARFIQIYCASHHSDEVRPALRAKGITGEFLKDVSVQLCPDCNKLLLHGVGKSITCPYAPKPRCRKCPTYCYRQGYREKIRPVMRFSGAHLLKRGRLDLALKYFF